MTDPKVLRALRRLYRIADAGEKGFATAAANMAVPALIIFFKLQAQQRLSFKDEIYDELRRLGDESRPGISMPGAIHRGRVAIFAGISDRDRQEQVILKEASIGEGVAEREYARALEQDLPAPTRALIERQYAEVRRAANMVRCLRDDALQRSALRLAQSEEETRRTVQGLVNDLGYNPNQIETLEIDNRALYDGRGATQAETILSGIFGGALWGGLMGILAGIGVVWTTDPASTVAMLLTGLLTFLSFAAIGAFISGVLAFFISAGTRGHDTYQYTEARQNARYLVHAVPCPPAGEAAA